MIWLEIKLLPATAITASADHWAVLKVLQCFAQFETFEVFFDSMSTSDVRLVLSLKR